jgi:hypothetical protein
MTVTGSYMNVGRLQCTRGCFLKPLLYQVSTNSIQGFVIEEKDVEDMARLVFTFHNLVSMLPNPWKNIVYSILSNPLDNHTLVFSTFKNFWE